MTAATASAVAISVSTAEGRVSWPKKSKVKQIFIRKKWRAALAPWQISALDAAGVISAMLFKSIITYALREWISLPVALPKCLCAGEAQILRKSKTRRI